jgi:Zn-dependent M28 family amino/carboxypeptidase
MRYRVRHVSNYSYGSPVDLEFTIVNREYPEGHTTYNVVAEIPGTDKKDEIVMLGGHYDSWHDATGATDNGIGSSMMLEAVRILTALHVKPRRTIRIALWSGEEVGLLGSLAYVREHFGSAENPKPEFSKLDAYFNIDYRSGSTTTSGVTGPRTRSSNVAAGARSRAATPCGASVPAICSNPSSSPARSSATSTPPLSSRPATAST